MEIFSALHTKWRIVTYNFGWEDFRQYIDGWLPKLSYTIPIFGYLIIFNDEVASKIDFSIISERDGGYEGLSSTLRLQLIYFALLLLGVANILYRWRKPYVFKIGRSEYEYMERGLNYFGLSYYVEGNSILRTEGRRTGADYYSSEFDGFIRCARGDGEGTDKVNDTANWELAKKKYEHVMRAIMRETYFRSNTSNRTSLIICILFASIGYIGLAVPSIDLFIKVLVAISS